MKVTCPSCQTNYNIDDKRIPPGGAKIKCAKCQNTFPVRPAAAAPVEGALPLPAPAAPQAGAIPLPGLSAPSFSPPREQWETESTRVAPLPQGGAVPLPGNDPWAAAPPAGDPFGNEGEHDWESQSTRVAPMPTGAVPLPGGSQPFDSEPEHDWEQQSTRVHQAQIPAAAYGGQDPVPLPGGSWSPPAAQAMPFDAPAEDPFGQDGDWESQSTRVAPMP